ncbi:PPOX class F420-dependent oxidoreductase [Microbispora sp. NPDC049125]|uniref:PPOX class F420-dependent oxidoreductase n=1 Tax=Microbispora sp. NPDC049125 TaxID=3154929 RepID=UPI0034674C6F
MIFTELEIGYLDDQRLGRLATIQPGGTLQVSPVSFTYNRKLETIDISGHNMAASRKFRNVLDNGKVAFVVDDVLSLDPWQVRCLEIRGYGEALKDPVDSAAMFPGPIIRLHARRVISFGIDPGNPAAGARDVQA